MYTRYILQQTVVGTVEVVGHVSSTVAVWVPSHIQKLYIVQ